MLSLRQIKPRMLIFVALATFSAFLHFVRLAEPREVVFDEFHFGPYLNSYLCTGSHYFDIHPPHPKLLMTIVGAWVGYDCSVPFGDIGTSYGDVSPALFRAVPALFGTLLPLLLVWLMRLWHFPWPAAFLAGFAVCLDNAFLVQSRLILLDVFLLFGTLLALGAYQSALDRRHTLWWTIVAGAGAALALGTKFSGAFVLGMVFVLELRRQWSQRNLMALAKRLATFLATFCLLYGLGWYIHWHTLDAAGSGDLWFKPTGNAWQDTWTAHRHMLSAGVGLDKGHQDASRPWGWFFMHTPIYYWHGAAKIYFLGNPVVWWGGACVFFAALAHALVVTVKSPRQHMRWWQQNSLPLIGFAASYLPLLPLSRPLFLYHFLTPLLFLLIFSCGQIETFISQQSVSRQKYLWFGLTMTLVLGFIYIAPLTYGTVAMSWLPEEVFYMFPSWR